MAGKLVLVTGVTGTTGDYVVSELIERGVPVRGMVRKDDERADKLRARGVDIVIGDLLDFDSLGGALDGVRAAYLVYPLHARLLDATAYFAEAAREAGVEAIVNMSQISARREARSHQARDHYIAQGLLDRSGVSCTHLRPTFFAQWLLYPWSRRSIIEHGQLRLPFGAGRHAPIAAEDQARVIAAILADPTLHAGRSYDLFGPVEMDHHEIAGEIGRVLGRDIAYVPIEIDEFRTVLESMRLPEQMIQHLCAVALDYRNGIFAGTNNAVEQITGRPPMTVGAFVSAHRDRLQR